MKGRVQHRRGLTLTEVIVVIAIIVLLIAILMPALTRMRQHARNVTCMSNLHQIELALRQREESDTVISLPFASEWVGHVLDSAAGAHAILRCPDGEGYQSAGLSGEGLDFGAWYGNGRGNPSNSMLNGNAPWRPTRVDLGPDRYVKSWEYRPNSPARLVVEFSRTSDDLWTAKVIEEPHYFRTDAWDAQGNRYINISVGQTFGYAPDRGTTDYGFNLIGSGVRAPVAGKLVAMDYQRNIIDLDGFNAEDLDAAGKPMYIPGLNKAAARHLRKVNVLLSDGSVQSLTVDQVRPYDPIYAIGPAMKLPGSKGGKGQPSPKK